MFKDRKVCLTFLIMFFLISCADAQVGGMTPEQAFSTPNTAAMVKAVMSSDYSQANNLISQGADVNAEGAEGLTPLLWVLVASDHDEKRIEYLLKKGANPNHQDPKHHASAMYLAVENEKPKLLKLLLKYGGNPSLVGAGHGGEDWSLLSIAALSGQDEIVKTLVEAGADLNWISERGSSAADRAIGGGRFDLAAYLLDHGLSVGLDHTERRAKAVKVSGNMQAWKDKVLVMLQERKVNQNK